MRMGSLHANCGEVSSEGGRGGYLLNGFSGHGRLPPLVVVDRAAGHFNFYVGSSTVSTKEIFRNMLTPTPLSSTHCSATGMSVLPSYLRPLASHGMAMATCVLMIKGGRGHDWSSWPTRRHLPCRGAWHRRWLEVGFLVVHTPCCGGWNL